jgi:hypothetical protein
VAKTKKKELVVVLGMHRSGTSAIARGLTVLGVELGDNLYPAAIDNPKGFWEDRDILEINEELLAIVGSASDQIGLFDRDMPNTNSVETLRIKAEKLIDSRCEEHAIWGFKDPRTARLLDFWQTVFGNLSCEVSYVIASRNPISIARSIHKRDGYEEERTFYLWLEYLIPAISKTNQSKRVIVDFDRLLENTELELSRVSQALELPPPKTLALAAYKNEFLESRMRHTRFEAHELESYPLVPKQVVTAYDLLDKLASDRVDSDSYEIANAFEILTSELLALSPVLEYSARQDKKIADRTEALTHARMQDLLTANTWLTTQRDAWERTAIEREQVITDLQSRVNDLLAAQREVSVYAFVIRVKKVCCRLWGR